MTNDELNKWIASWLGVKIYDGDMDTHYYYETPDKVLHLREKWNPCRDRNQCWLAVEKILTVKGGDRILINEVHGNHPRYRFLEEIENASDVHAQNARSEMLHVAMLLSPREICETIYEAIAED